jgi:creatinine amidohydrolase
MAEVRWQKLRREQVAEMAATGGIPLLPIGSVEQHGPHLPLDTDSHAATTVAERAALRLAETADPLALVLPPIWWGLSPYWLPFPGTLSLRPETILALIADLGASVARHGFRRLVIVNGHGGNEGIIGVAATQLADHGIRAAALSYWELIGNELRQWSHHDGGSIGHAGEVETSISLALQPDLVDVDQAGSVAGADLSRGSRFPYVGYAPPDPERESPSGVYGVASAGRPELGEDVIDLAAERLAEFVREFVRTPLSPLPVRRERGRG